jgi:hypothetical protein
MKLTSGAFSKWYLERDFQGVRLYDETGKQPEKFKSIYDAAHKIIDLRLMDESGKEMDVTEHLQLELRIKEEVFKAVDPTGHLIDTARQRGLLPQEAVV